MKLNCFTFVTKQVRSVRLVDDDGIIRPVTFYKYLMVWFNMDFMGYTMSQVCELNNYQDVYHTGSK